MRACQVEARHYDNDRGTGNRSPVDYCGSHSDYSRSNNINRFEFSRFITNSNNNNDNNNNNNVSNYSKYNNTYRY